MLKRGRVVSENSSSFIELLLSVFASLVSLSTVMRDPENVVRDSLNGVTLEDGVVDGLGKRHCDRRIW